MSAEYDIHAETESEDGGVPLEKVESDEMDIDAGSDTTPTSQGSGESSSSTNDAWGETLPSPLDELSEHGDPPADYQSAPTFHDSMTPPFSIAQASLSTTSPSTSEAPQTLGTIFTANDAGYGTIDQVQYPHSTNHDTPMEVRHFSGFIPPFTPLYSILLPKKLPSLECLSQTLSNAQGLLP